MGTTADKGAYLNNTKLLLKQKINNLGGDITNNTTFRQYANQLQTIYDNAPKTSYAEGSNITLSNTLKGKLDFEDDIVGYGQTSQKSYQGYNELNLQDYTETINGVTITIKNGVIKLNGNSTNYTTKVIPQATTSQFNGEYNLNYEYVSGTTNNPANLNLYNGSQEIATLYFGNLSRNQSVTFNQDTISIRIYFHNNAEFNNYIIKPMLYKGAYDSTKTFEPYVGGTASPNPSYPQDIEVVRGKNRLDDSNLVLFNSNKYISTTNYSTQGKIAVKPNTTYTLAYKTSTLNDMGMWEFDSSNNKSTISYTPKGAGYYSIRIFTTLSTTKTMSFYAGSNDTYTSVEEFLQAKELMLLEGDYSSQSIPSYLPYNTLEVKIQNKNLCTEMEQGDVSTSTGEASSYQPTTSGFIRSKDYIPVKPSEVITVSYKNTATSSSQIVIFEYNANKTYIGFYYSNASTYTRTLGNETAYIKIRLQDTTNTLSNNTEIQVEYGNTKTSYVEHQEQIKQLSLGEYEFAKIGNYVDTIEYDVDEDKVYKNKNILKISIKDSTNVRYQISLDNNSRFTYYTSPSLDIINATSKGFAYCNRLTLENGFSLDTVHFYTWSTVVYFFLPNNIANSLETFATWVANNNLEFYIPLNNTVKEEITGTLKDQIKALYNMKSFNGTTIIEIDGQLPLIIKVRALKGN